MALSTDKSQSSQWAKPLEGPLPVVVHPDAARGIDDGAVARLCSPVGAMLVRVRHDARQRRDVALVPKGGHLRDGRCANALIRARTTDLGEGGALYDDRVGLVAIEDAGNSPAIEDAGNSPAIEDAGSSPAIE
jgi:anaerobic selenocysteine-containing dehydrogenase